MDLLYFSGPKEMNYDANCTVFYKKLVYVGRTIELLFHFLIIIIFLDFLYLQLNCQLTMNPKQ